MMRQEMGSLHSEINCLKERVHEEEKKNLALEDENYKLTIKN
jgi:hypothetical protein